MPNLIRIKRSLETAIPASLANGEFGYTANGDVLYIGSNDAIVAIGGRRVPGTLTANQAMVVNSTSYIDVVRTANLYINAFTVNAINAVANATHLGAAGNNELTTTWAIKTYVDIKTGGSTVGGSNTHIQYNDSGAFNGSAGFTYDESTNNVFLANTLLLGSGTTNVVSNNTTWLARSNSTTNASATVAGFFIGNTAANYANLTLAGLLIGNSTVNSSIVYDAAFSLRSGAANAINMEAGTSSISLINNADDEVYITAGGISLYDDAGALTRFNVTTARLHFGNTTQNVVTTNAQILISTNSTTNSIHSVSQFLISNTAGHFANVDISGFFHGNSTVNAIANSNGLLLQTNSTTNSLMTISSVRFQNTAGQIANLAIGGLMIGTSTANLTATGSQVLLQTNSTTNSLMSISQFRVANTTGHFANVDITGLFHGNSTVNATANSTTFLLQSNSTTNSYQLISQFRVANTAGHIALVDIARFFHGNSTINAISNSVTWLLQTNSTTNATATISSIIFANTAGTSANLSLTGLHIGNSTVNSTLTSTALTTNTINAHDVTLTGNLSVAGTLVTFDATNIVVNDSIIELARNNGGSSLDIGIFGQYNDGTERFTGLIWDVSASRYELFVNTTAAPTTTLDTGATGYRLALLRSYLDSAGLVSNATNVSITGNSSLTVAIAANTLSLTTALPVTSGGTGFLTIADGEILVGNTGNAFSKLARGTDGYVLQANSTAVFYGILDGGTF